jgi:hypothetical protein
LESFKCDPSAEITQGELLIHVLEERFYMQGPGIGYEEAHSKCLSPNSFQNKYRRELGYKSDTVWFELEEIFKEGDENVMANFWSLDMDGCVTRTSFLPVSKAEEPLQYANYDAKNNIAFSETVNFEQFASKFVNDKLLSIKQKIVTSRQFPERPVLDSVKHFLNFMYPLEREDKELLLLGTLLINNCVLKTLGIIHSKFKMCKTPTTWEKLLSEKELHKITTETLKDISKKNNVKLPQNWITKISTNDTEITSELEKTKIAFVATLSDKQKLFTTPNSTDVQTPTQIYDTIQQYILLTFFSEN